MMFDWEAELIEALNEIDPYWRDDYASAEDAARELYPDFPGLQPEMSIGTDDEQEI